MRAKEGGKETAFFFLLPMVSCGSSLRFAPPLCDKELPEEELVQIPGRIEYKLKSEKVENSRSHKSIEKLPK